jgi:uridine kinase
MNLINSQELSSIVQRLTILGKDDFVREEEARYGRQIKYVADYAAEHGVRIVLLAGPSGSGKTTTAHNIARDIEKRGRKVFSLSMDDWYMTADRYTMPLDENGEPDYESPLCLDMDRLNNDIRTLSEGGEISLPTYDFVHRVMVETGKKMRLGPDDVMIMEGLHALNPAFELPREGNTIKIYVSPADVVVDDTHVIDNQYIRLCRRIRRDMDSRGMTPEETIVKSHSVDRGERLYVAPYLKNVGVLRIDTLLGYELFIHRREFPKMSEFRCVPLSKITRADIPEGSILREFYKV